MRQVEEQCVTRLIPFGSNVLDHFRVFQDRISQQFLRNLFHRGETMCVLAIEALFCLVQQTSSLLALRCLLHPSQLTSSAIFA